MKQVTGLDPLAVELDRLTDRLDREVAVRNDRVAHEIVESDGAHLVDVAQGAIGDHADGAEPLGEGGHHFAGVGARSGAPLTSCTASTLGPGIAARASHIRQ